jgi:hypothetical protein
LEYPQLLAKGKYGFYVKTPDKKRVIIEVEKQKLVDCKLPDVFTSLCDDLSKQVQTLLSSQS